MMHLSDSHCVRRPRCLGCGAVFEPWEECFSWDVGGESGHVCADCFDLKFGELTRCERAALIGSEILPAELLSVT